MEIFGLCADFRVGSSISGFLRLVFGIVWVSIQAHPWNIWYFLFLLVGAIINFLYFKESFKNTLIYGRALACFTILDFGHLYSSILLASPNYTDQKYYLEYPLLGPLGFFVCGTFLWVLAYIHRKRRLASLNNLEDDFNGAAQHETSGWSIFSGLLCPASALVFGTAESRLGAGKVPSPPCLEGFFGLCTAGLLIAFFTNKFRTSAWGICTSCVWILFTFTFFIVAIVKSSSSTDAPQFNLSAWCWFVYFFFFTSFFALKFCLLRERFHLNFYATAATGSVKASTTIATPSSAYPDQLPADAFGVTHAEAESSARKLGIESRKTEADLESHLGWGGRKGGRLDDFERKQTSASFHDE